MQGALRKKQLTASFVGHTKNQEYTICVYFAVDVNTFIITGAGCSAKVLLKNQGYTICVYFAVDEVLLLC